MLYAEDLVLHGGLKGNLIDDVKVNKRRVLRVNADKCYNRVQKWGVGVMRVFVNFRAL